MVYEEFFVEIGKTGKPRVLSYVKQLLFETHFFEMELRLYICKKVLIKAQSQAFIPEKLRNKDIINVVKPSFVPIRKKIYFKLKRTKILTFISIALFPFQLQVWYSHETLTKNLNLNKTSDLI